MEGMNHYFFLFSFGFLSCRLIHAYPQEINIGVIASRLTTSGDLYVDGSHRISAIFMALEEINDKTDGVHDDLLIKTEIKFALRTPMQTFMRGLKAAESLKSTFGGKGVKAVIGTGGDETSRAAGQVFGYNEGFKINQIDFSAAGSFLSHADLYPYYNRVNSVDAHVGNVIATYIKDQFGYDNVNVFSTGDTYGTDVGLEFKNA
eukprot:gene15916-33523_t